MWVPACEGKTVGCEGTTVGCEGKTVGCVSGVPLFGALASPFGTKWDKVGALSVTKLDRRRCLLIGR